MVTTLDVYTGYLQVLRPKTCTEMTTLTCRFENYKFEFMPFWLMNAINTFQRIMDKVPRGIPVVVKYVDDDYLCSQSAEEHLDHCQEVFEWI